MVSLFQNILLYTLNTLSILTEHFTHCGRNVCSLRCNSKTGMNFFSLHHSFTDKRLVLTADFSNCSIFFFSFPIKLRTFTFYLKKLPHGFSLAYSNDEHHYSCTLGPLISKIRVAAATAKSLQSCLTLCDPIDGSPPGSPIPGILQARTLEWVAIAFSNA